MPCIICIISMTLQGCFTTIVYSTIRIPALVSFTLTLFIKPILSFLLHLEILHRLPPVYCQPLNVILPDGWFSRRLR